MTLLFITHRNTSFRADVPIISLFSCIHYLGGAELVSALYEKAGKPVVDSVLNYTDISPDAAYAAAVRWATDKKLINGYENGTFGPESTLSREQFVTILWRYADSPILTDHTGLTEFPDAADITPFARQGMMWAHQKRWLTAAADGRLAPPKSWHSPCWLPLSRRTNGRTEPLSHIQLLIKYGCRPPLHRSGGLQQMRAFEGSHQYPIAELGNATRISGKSIIATQKIMKMMT